MFAGKTHKDHQHMTWLCKVRKNIITACLGNILSIPQVHSGFLVYFKRISSSGSKTTVVARFFDRCEYTQNFNNKKISFTYKIIDTCNKSMTVVKTVETRAKKLQITATF